MKFPYQPCPLHHNQIKCGVHLTIDMNILHNADNSLLLHSVVSSESFPGRSIKVKKATCSRVSCELINNALR